MFFSLGLILTFSPSWLVDGSPLTLTCVNQLRQRLPAQTQFRFLKDGSPLGRGWAHSSQYQVAAVWSEDSGYYQCEVWTAAHRTIKSKDVRIDIQSERPTGGVWRGGAPACRRMAV